MSKSDGITKGGRWRWRWAFLFVFSAHAALVFWFGERVLPVETPSRPAPLLFIAADQQTIANLEQLVPAGDPTLFALPNDLGFSGGAWLTLVRTDFTLSNWTATPKWLPVPAGSFGSFVTEVAETNRVPAEDLLAQRSPVDPFDFRVPATVLSTASTFAVEGQVAARLTSTPQVPSAIHTDLLTNTVVEVAVRADGIVETVMLTTACGAGAADEAALTLARDLVFNAIPGEPQATSGIERGRIVFTWHVVPPATGNGASAGTP